MELNIAKKTDTAERRMIMLNHTNYMNTKIKVVLDEGATLPTRAHPTDAGLDLYAKERRVVWARSCEKLDTGVHVQIPEGYVGFITSKSGLMAEKGITCL